MSDFCYTNNCNFNFNHKFENKYALPLESIEVLEDVCFHVVDRNGKTIYYSKGCENIEGYKKKEIIGKHVNEIYRTAEDKPLDKETSMQLKVLNSSKPVKNKPIIYKTLKNRKIHVISSTYPIICNNKAVGVICVFKDISQMVNLSKMIEILQNDLDKKRKTNSKNGTIYYFNDIVGSSYAIKNIVKISKKVALNECPILLWGETGTGKELFAQSIHNYSLFSDGPFVPVNCSAIPETLLESILFGTKKGAFTGAQEKTGLFEKAQNGTLFLDEINSMSMALQSKLLRVLENKTIRKVGSNEEIPINTRIISAANTSPKEAINNNDLRPDLYYRLAVVSLRIPPLRDRMEDLHVLIKHFIKTNNKAMNKNVKNISKEAYKILKKYNWPGNIRQLKHAIDYAMNVIEVNKPIIELKHLPKYITGKPCKQKIKTESNNSQKDNYKDTLRKIEKNIITKELKRNDYNISATSRDLGISRQSLQYRIKTLNIDIKTSY